MAAAAGSSSRFQAFMNHPAGPKTGIKDLSRPAEKLSVSQNVALAATGMIWVRYSLVITPINYSLAAVNACVGLSGLTQLYRIWDYNSKQGGSPVLTAVKDAEQDIKQAGKDIKAEAKSLEKDVRNRI